MLGAYSVAGTVSTLTSKKRPQPELLVDEVQGRYIPFCFVQNGATNWGLSPEEEHILLHPDHVAYWDVWDEVVNRAEYVDENGTHWSLYQYGDLWAIPHGMVWDEETDWFVWSEDDDEITSAIDRLSNADNADARKALGLEG